MKYEEMRKLIETVKGSTFAGITTKTSVKLLGGKKNPMQNRVEKLTENSNVMIFSNCTKSGYEEMVKRRMIQENKDSSDFIVSNRAWGTRIGNSPFIEHNGKMYLECVFMKSGKSKYLLDGIEINRDDIEGMPVKKEPTEAYINSQGGIEDKVIIRTFSIDSIVSMKMRGKII
jgi:hypothetical protein